MSFKAKNLSYEQNEPAFLRRMRGEVAGIDPHRHERQVARPKRLKNGDEEDDGPTIVDESNDTLSKAEYEALMGEKVEKESDAEPAESATSALQDGNGNGEDVQEKEDGGLVKKQQIAEAGKSQKKRKVGKVVGEAEEEEEDRQQKKPEAKKVKKKVKAVKLSFGDDD
ncbi:hypothetical protein H2201_004601 [Coniosporium apollinis]|uniref:DUF4604 domain-containing protein n=2 Tax=Coniosporium TaxID=2810619 RepID=A0ABQ9NSE4_9PEZI|nr:hypothetical protein H2199_006732 [Cladosporium sp. JES 115]KAJ9665309.1 hypothetical protein H2201_004601 [Coniosporium apollinis]